VRATPADDESVGIYLHIPFCARICPYCDFAVVRVRDLRPATEARYVEALIRELDARAGSYRSRRLATVYFGGGTPSLLDPNSVSRLLGEIGAHFDGAPEEVTLEANPTSVEAGRFTAFRAAGITRLSLGVQSFQDLSLRRLGRGHRARDVDAALEVARRTGFARISLDLIFAVPDQSLADLEADLARAAAFAPDHVSAYALTVESGTPFATAQRRGQLRLPDEERWLAMYRAVVRELGRAGLQRYEISSYARPGAEARHNRRYWERRPVLGLGMGAWSHEAPSAAAPFGRRWANRTDLAGYLEAVEGGALPDAQPPETLSECAARGEAMFLGLRTRAGVCAERFAAEFGARPRSFFGAAIQRLVEQGLLIEAPSGGLHLSERGFLLSDSVFEAFV